MKRTGFTIIELMTVVAIIGILIALLLPAVQSAREAARKYQCKSNLINIGLAIKQFENAHGYLPSGTRNETGPIRNVPVGDHMGWIPFILGHMEQTPLAEMIDYSKGVYDPVNREAWLSKHPNILGCPSDGYSFQLHSYMACSGGDEKPIDTDNRGVFYLNSKLRSRDIADGASHTIFVGESVAPRSYSYYGYHGDEDTLDPREKWRQERIAAWEAEGKSDENMDMLWHAEIKYANLGWMSGTPGTIRNTGSKMKEKVPLAFWPLPFKEGSNEINSDGFPWSDKISDEKTTLDLWKTVYDEQYEVGGFGSNHTGGSNFLFGDGRVDFINDEIDPDVYSRLGNRNDEAL